MTKRRSSRPTGHPGRHDRPVIVARTSAGSTVTVPVKVGAGGVTGGRVAGGFVAGGAAGTVGGSEAGGPLDGLGAPLGAQAPNTNDTPTIAAPNAGGADRAMCTPTAWHFGGVADGHLSAAGR